MEATAKPSEVRVGQRWQEDDPAATPYTVTAVSEKGAQLEFDDHAPTGGYWYRLDSVLEDNFLGYAPGLGSPPVAGVRPEPAKGQRWRHVKHGHGLVNGAVFTLGEQLDAKTWSATGPFSTGRISSDWAISDAWLADASDFEFVDHGALTTAPTTVPAKGCKHGCNSDAPITRCHRNHAFVTCVCACHAPAPATNVVVDRGLQIENRPGVTASKPPLREVSANGRDWLNYERLTDSDSFDSYRHRRVDGVVVAMAEPRGYGGDTWSNHLYMDRQRRAYLDSCDSIRPAPVPAPATPWLSTDSKPPQQHAYSARSGR